jgi:uncharacterized protein YndB with AHSA1/START domain
VTVTGVSKDRDQLTMSMTTEFNVSVERAWELWNDPRQLERWWGPPMFPATVVDHDLTTGGLVTYYMTGPQGEQPWGKWDVQLVDAPRRLEVKHSFTDDQGNVIDGMPTMDYHVQIVERPTGGVVMTILTKFPSIEALDQLLAMQMEEGLTQALGQMDTILTEQTV